MTASIQAAKVIIFVGGNMVWMSRRGRGTFSCTGGKDFVIFQKDMSLEVYSLLVNSLLLFKHFIPNDRI